MLLKGLGSPGLVRSIALWCHLFFISAHVTRGLVRSIFLFPVQECESKALLANQD